jgi:serine phosphatase RsbU (regulator of sigma subunit)
VVGGSLVAVLNDISEQKAIQAEIASDRDLMADSIRYASKIQRSLLPSEVLLKRLIADYFIIWEPRDVVGGDMYWIKEDRHGYFVTLFDCTGHGVPGALLTTITTSALNVAFNETADPARLISQVNRSIKNSLGQIKGIDGDSDDGVEMGICFIEPDRMRATFSGAKFNLVIGQGSDFQVIKGDKSSVGYRHVELDYKFTNHSIRLQRGQRFYLYSDGITDQIGGEKRRAFGRKRMMNILNSVALLPMAQQGAQLKSTFERYHGLESRRDDVSFIGFKPLN